MLVLIYTIFTKTSAIYDNVIYKNCFVYISLFLFKYAQA